MKTNARERKPDAGRHPDRPVHPANDTTSANPAGVRPTPASATEIVPSKWRWHHRVLTALHERLLRQRSETLQTVAQPLEPHSLHEADSASDEFDHDLALCELSVELDALGEVEAALQRMRDGVYGICEETGAAIAPGRLEAIPWARYTTQVQARLEREGAIFGRRLAPAAGVRGEGAALAPLETESEEEETPADEALPRVFKPSAAARH